MTGDGSPAGAAGSVAGPAGEMADWERTLARQFIVDHGIVSWLDDEGEPHESALRDVVKFMRGAVREAARREWDMSVEVAARPLAEFVASLRERLYREEGGGGAGTAPGGVPYGPLAETVELLDLLSADSPAPSRLRRPLLEAAVRVTYFNLSGAPVTLGGVISALGRTPGVDQPQVESLRSVLSRYEEHRGCREAIDERLAATWGREGRAGSLH